MTVGADAGKKEIMEQVAPAGPMYQAGTLSGNPLAMRAGIETMKILKQPGSYEYLDKITGKLINGILDAAKEAGHAVCGGHISGMFGFFFCEGPVKSFADAPASAQLPLSSPLKPPPEACNANTVLPSRRVTATAPRASATSASWPVS